MVAFAAPAGAQSLDSVTIPAGLKPATRGSFPALGRPRVKPLDETLVLRLAAQHELLVSVEDNSLCGGAGSAVGEVLTRRALAVGLLALGLADEFLEHGTREEVLAQCGLDATGIRGAVLGRRARHERCARLHWR